MFEFVNFLLHEFHYFIFDRKIVKSFRVLIYFFFSTLQTFSVPECSRHMSEKKKLSQNFNLNISSSTDGPFHTFTISMHSSCKWFSFSFNNRRCEFSIMFFFNFFVLCHFWDKNKRQKCDNGKTKTTNPWTQRI